MVHLLLNVKKKHTLKPVSKKLGEKKFWPLSNELPSDDHVQVPFTYNITHLYECK